MARNPLWRLPIFGPVRPPTSAPTRTATSGSGRASRPSQRPTATSSSTSTTTPRSPVPTHDQRPGFMEMLRRVASNGAKTIIVESPDRFARDLTVQLTGHDMLKAQGIALVPASAPDFFTEDTPTAVLVRQVLGAIAQFDKASTVAKLAAARKRKREATGKCEGRKSLGELHPDVVALARHLRRRGPKGGQLTLGPSRPSWRRRATSTSADGLTMRSRWQSMLAT